MGNYVSSLYYKIYKSKNRNVNNIISDRNQSQEVINNKEEILNQDHNNNNIINNDNNNNIINDNNEIDINNNNINDKEKEKDKIDISEDINEINNKKKPNNENIIEENIKELKPLNSNTDQGIEPLNEEKEKVNSFNNNPPLVPLGSNLTPNKDINSQQINSEELDIYENIDLQNEDINLKQKLHMLIKNLEAKNANIDTIKEKIDIIFNQLYDEFMKDNNNSNENLNDKLEVIKKEMIKKINCVFVDTLNLKNIEDLIMVKRLLINIYKESGNNLNQFKEYLSSILENFKNFSLLSERSEKTICNYIINNLYVNEIVQNKKDELKEKYKNNYIISFEEFTDIVKMNKISMDDEAIEYLIYKMKCESIKDEINLMNSLNIKVFLDFLDKNEEEDDSN